MKRLLTRWFIIVFLGVQLVLPIRSLVFDRYYTRGNFTWNMYAHAYSCRWEYVLVTSSGQEQGIPLKRFFHRRNRAMGVFHSRVLPHFHAYLCDELRDELGSIRAAVNCSWDHKPRRDLVEPGTDICTADNYGVTEH